MKTEDMKVREVLEDECGLGFPAEYYDAVDPEDFRKVFRAGKKDIVGWLEARGGIMEFINMHYEEDWQNWIGGGQE